MEEKNSLDERVESGQPETQWHINVPSKLTNVIEAYTDKM